MKFVQSSVLLMLLGSWMQACAPALRIEETYTLAHGEGLRFRTQGLKKEELRFEGVIEDSRCPTGVNCIQAGRALAQMAVRDTSFAVEEGQVFLLGKHSILLQSILPYPQATDTQARRPEDYRILIIPGKTASRAH